MRCGPSSAKDLAPKYKWHQFKDGASQFLSSPSSARDVGGELRRALSCGFCSSLLRTFWARGLIGPILKLVPGFRVRVQARFISNEIESKIRTKVLFWAELCQQTLRRKICGKNDNTRETKDAAYKKFLKIFQVTSEL